MSPRGFRRRFGLGIALAFLTPWCASLRVCADEPPQRQVMVLQSGRLLEGRITREQNGFVVEHSAGRIVVPFEEARVVGDDLPDAFRRLKESFVNPTAATHFELAMWCSSHQLHEQMRTELVQALDRDPDHAAARDWLDRIDAEHKAARMRAKAATMQDKPRIVHGIELPEVESLAGLSRETAALFTTRIQPLLLNKCGNASCHGARTETSFQLEPTRGTGRGHRVHSEQNLAMTLKELDLSRPAESPILQHGARPHGGMARSPFTGPTGEKQLKTLRNWLRMASMELQHDQQPAAELNRSSAQQPKFPIQHGPVQTAAATDDEAESQASVRNSRERPSIPKSTRVMDRPPHPDPLPHGGEGTKASRPVRAATELDEPDAEPDAFDPEEFNRRHHGEPARPKKAIKPRERKTEP